MSNFVVPEIASLIAQCSITADLFRVMANPTRLTLLYYLSKGECSVSELERELGLRQPNLSQQLAELRQKGLVKTRRESRSIFYGISDPRIVPILRALHGPIEPPVIESEQTYGPKNVTKRKFGEQAIFARVTREAVFA